MRLINDDKSMSRLIANKLIIDFLCYLLYLNQIFLFYLFCYLAFCIFYQY